MMHQLIAAFKILNMHIYLHYTCLHKSHIWKIILHCCLCKKRFSLKMVCVVGCWVGGDSMPCVFDDDDDYINVVGCYPACLMMMSLPRTATPHLGGPPTDVFASDHGDHGHDDSFDDGHHGHCGFVYIHFNFSISDGLD